MGTHSSALTSREQLANRKIVKNRLRHDLVISTVLHLTLMSHHERKGASIKSFCPPHRWWKHDLRWLWGEAGGYTLDESLVSWTTHIDPAPLPKGHQIYNTPMDNSQSHNSVYINLKSMFVEWGNSHKYVGNTQWSMRFKPQTSDLWDQILTTATYSPCCFGCQPISAKLVPKFTFSWRHQDCKIHKYRRSLGLVKS